MAERFANILVEESKLRDYCLSDSHSRGRHKARVFRSRLGLTANDWKFLQQSLLDAVNDNYEVLLPTECDEFGQRYVLDFPLTTSTGTAVVRSAWIVLTGQNVLRLTTCYVL